MTPHPETGRGRSKEPSQREPPPLGGRDSKRRRKHQGNSRFFMASRAFSRLPSPRWVSYLGRKRTMIALSPRIMGRGYGWGVEQKLLMHFCQHLWFLQYPARLLAVPQGWPCSSRHPPFPINGKWLGSRVCACVVGEGAGMKGKGHGGFPTADLVGN